MDNTVNSNLGQTVSPIKRVTQVQEVEADNKIDDAIKLKEVQSTEPLRQSDFATVKYEQLEAPANAPSGRADVSLVEIEQEEIRVS